MRSGRRIARELAAIVMSQLPKDRDKLERQEIEGLIAKSVSMLCDYAKQDLQDADAMLATVAEHLTATEVEHPSNADAVTELKSVPVNTAQLKEVREKLERALLLAAEALDIPDMAILTGHSTIIVDCKNCGHATETFLEKPRDSDVREYLVRLLTVYHEHKGQIDQYIKSTKSKWNVDRMVSIDRDILRLACTEAFYIDEVPINVCISEAVELAHRFADEKAAKFINGILSDLVDEAKHFRLRGKFKEPSSDSADDDRSLSKL